MLLNKIEHQQKIKELKEKIDKKIEENTKLILYKKKLIQTFRLKNSYDSVIPLHLYTCWHGKDLPPLMKENFDFLVDSNPKISFHLYDENDCREFIRTHFKPDVVDAYDRLIPCSYKSDLWRYCVLFINGGMYMDIKFKCINNFKLIALTESEHFVRDIANPAHPAGTLTGLMVCKPGNNILFHCIRRIVDNVNNNFYGISALCPTGPALLGEYFTKNQKKQMNIHFENIFVYGRDNFYIVYNDGEKEILVFKIYDEYRSEQKVYQKNAYYADLWNEKNIYGLTK